MPETMMEKEADRLIKINLPGGVVSAGDLYEMLIIAEKSGAGHVRIGSRQQLYFKVPPANMEGLESDMLCANIDYETDADCYPNIVSSYAAEGLFNQDNWLKQGVYKDLLDLFDHKPALKINIIDSTQTFVPFFTGNLNFISSATSNYWYLYIRYPKTNLLYCWPGLIYSDDIPALSKRIEEAIHANKSRFYAMNEVNSIELYQMVMEGNDFVVQESPSALKIPEFSLSPYEGLNRYGNKYWLGIYCRNELFSIDFLKDICLLCLNARVGQVYMSTWKSVLIKNIEIADHNLWRDLVCRNQLNLRHSANELNWQVEDLCDYCLDYKQQLVKVFDEMDVLTDRLSFGISRTPGCGLFGAILIKEKEGHQFEILHTHDFNPNSKDFILYAQNVKTEDLSRCLIAVCDKFYELQNSFLELQMPYAVAEETQLPNDKTVHQCCYCLTIYDEAYGEKINGIVRMVAFEDLNDYHCPTCDAEKEAFMTIRK